jgi:hypothetical protein
MKSWQVPASVCLSLCVASDARFCNADDKTADIQLLAQSIDGNVGSFGKNLGKFKDEAEHETLQRNAFNIRLLCTSIYNRAGDKTAVQKFADDLEKAVDNLKTPLKALQDRVGAQATMALLLSYSPLVEQAKELKDLAK